ncbi:flavin-dependent dehydrogenase [Pseudonocardia eucalypti]|uniref:FAD-dependent oxidoreductase n=1 Tax=Pseudonocardia eucalypti TaxID=648755 RepID=UPI00161B2763|nr:flavin-dependent dehydrogenase [Pseudonocardia eucalypti]
MSVGRVVVAGAGVAGPSAAFRLSRAGARVTVLERAGRVGARRPVCAYAVGGTA